MPEPEVEKPEEEQELSVDELKEQLAAEREKSTGLVSRLDRLEGMLIQQGVQAGGGGEEEAGEEEEPRRAPREEEPDFEGMGTKDMIRYVLGAIDKKLDAHNRDTDSKIARLATEAKAERLVTEIKTVMDDYGKDAVIALQPEIVRTMAGNPNLSVEDAYFLAARKAGKLPTGKQGEAKPKDEGGETSRESLLRDDLPPRGSTRPAKKEVAPTTFAEAGAQAWRKLGL